MKPVITLFALTLALLAPMALGQDTPPAAEAAEAAAAGPPQVTLETSKGKIVLELYPDKAPITVENFLKYVEAGHYDGTIFHRVIPGFMIQGGGFTADLVQKETGDQIANEAHNGLKNERGTIAMARTGYPHSATAQFFINLVANASLDHRSQDRTGWGYAVFGKVIEGMETVDAIAAVKTGTPKPNMQNVPEEAVVITKATVKRP